MEAYKAAVSKRIRRVTIFTICVAVFVISMHFFFVKTQEGATGNLFAFLEGGVISIDLLALFYMIQYRKALNDEMKLKNLYNREHDERNQFIKQKAGFPVMTAAGVMLIIGGVTAGYINSTVSYTMAACGIFVLLFQLILKFYFQRKY